MKANQTKTNAVRALDRASITYELRNYELAAEDFNAEAVAALLGMAPETIFKTLIAHGDVTGHLFALVPASSELDLRALATAAGNKRVELVPLRDVLDLTGYMRGAVTPLAAKKAYPVFIDETAEIWPQIGISGGMRGLQIVLAPDDLLRITGAQLANIAR
ncbi:Cys-tRNA(Pro) deacylase [Candidatus Gracilibacteria bacterium]|nr:Cys-tRNA(Pro) deacylase [Candidatus Gracilibacteria bacterium]